MVAFQSAYVISIVGNEAYENDIPRYAKNKNVILLIENNVILEVCRFRL